MISPRCRTITLSSTLIASVLVVFSVSAILHGAEHTKGEACHTVTGKTPPSSQSVTRSRKGFIEPGARVGPLRLGDRAEEALKHFPLKANTDQELHDSCGTTLNWVDSSNEDGTYGNVLIRIKRNRVFQIESATTRFRTRHGIKIYDSPEKVRKFHNNLRAYALLGPPLRALGDRPLIFWIDKKNGIAFAFAYYPEENRRYLYKIIVFRPDWGFCPEEDTTDSPNWQELAPYSLEVPEKVASVIKALKAANPPNPPSSNSHPKAP